ncbi:ribonuclease E/G [Asticcacaulis sp. AC402]|uniref:ribonuclease E/G n=1 Tax=Asticcacaulis sp. AC402 TaxID=1282361 RepID=UPI0003C3BF68|nr:ribonuclease E/G [Asticcacaulis sp. AC402]ESQ74011.1 hypothetical protein ABAC402_16055 [Asticcacaulis sp. AC402]
MLDPAVLTLHYEARFGLARGAVYWQGKPHLFAQGYEYDPSLAVLGTLSVARLRSRSGAIAFLKLADGTDAVLEGPPEILAKVNEGAAVEVEIIAEARVRGAKLARARFIAVATGDPRRLSRVLSLKDRLLERAHSLVGDMPVQELSDRNAIDEAQDEANVPSGNLPGGGYLSVESTRALIACDVDTAGSEAVMSPSGIHARVCNEAAIRDLPRRLRLAGLSGLVVVDLIGKRHDGDRLRTLLTQGFAAEASRIVIAPMGKFGTLEFVRPWGACPVGDDINPVTKALCSLGQAIRLSDQDRGRTIVIRHTAGIIDILRPLIVGALDPLAPMLRLEVSAQPEVIAL